MGPPAGFAGIIAIPPAEHSAAASMDRVIDPRPARRKRMIALGCIGGVVLVAVAFWSSSFTTSRVRVELAKVQVGEVIKGRFREFVPVTGTVQPIQTVFLDALEGGTVKQRYVEDGHMVKAGEAILELSNPQLHMDAINREAQLLDQQNNLRNTRLAMDQQTTRLRDELLNLDKDLKRLERDGIIMGYYARLNPEKLERNLLVFLEIKLSAKSGDVFEQVARDLSEIPEVLECHLISGDFDYLVKARLKEMSAYRRLLGDLLKKLPSSASSHSYVVMEEVKETLYLDVGI